MDTATQMRSNGGKARAAALSKEQLRAIARKGGRAAAQALSQEERRRRARHAVQARWRAYYAAHPEKHRGKKKTKTRAA